MRGYIHCPVRDPWPDLVPLLRHKHLRLNYLFSLYVTLRFPIKEGFLPLSGIEIHDYQFTSFEDYDDALSRD